MTIEVACKNKNIHVKFPIFLPDFNEIWIFRHQVGVALMRANRRAGMTKLIDAFRDIANAPSLVCVRACAWSSWAGS